MDVGNLALSEDWLGSVGFKWHQFDRQPHKHWLLWLGDSVAQDRMTSFEDIGIEVAPAWWFNAKDEKIGRDRWHCWLRSDAAGRYHRFIHLRYLSDQTELRTVIEAISGQPWDPANHMFGSLRSPEQAERIREEHKRLDQRLMRNAPRWSKVERDDTRGRSLPEHMEAHSKIAGGKS